MKESPSPGTPRQKGKRRQNNSMCYSGAEALRLSPSLTDSTTKPSPSLKGSLASSPCKRFASSFQLMRHRQIVRSSGGATVFGSRLGRRVETLLGCVGSCNQVPRICQAPELRAICGSATLKDSVHVRQQLLGWNRNGATALRRLSHLHCPH